MPKGLQEAIIPKMAAPLIKSFRKPMKVSVAKLLFLLIVFHWEKCFVTQWDPEASVGAPGPAKIISAGIRANH